MKPLVGQRWTHLANGKVLETKYQIAAAADWDARLSAAKHPGTYYEAFAVRGKGRITRYEPYKN